MAFDWREYFNLALFLQGQKCNYSLEASSRCAVSRAYYAAFCHTRNYARDQLGFRPTYRSEDHLGIRNHLRDCEMTRIASKLNHLRQWRNKCDYRDIVHNLSRICTSAINQTQEIFDELT